MRRQRREPATTPPKPGTITAIEQQARDPDRVSVFLDGSFAFGLARDVAEQASLSTGDHLDADAIRHLLHEEGRHRALSTALVYLGHRPRSEEEIRTRLRQDEHDADTIEMVIERLRDWRYVDDEDFARRWIENRLEHRPRGSRALSAELRNKGVDPTLIASALNEAEIDEDAGALEIARTRARQLAHLEPDVRDRRLAGFLGRRGYGYDVIRRTLEALADDSEDA